MGLGYGQKILNHIWTHWNYKSSRKKNTPKISTSFSLAHSLPLPPFLSFSLAFLLPFHKSSISLGILYLFLFKAMFQIILRLICTKMLSIIIFQISLCSLSYFRFKKTETLNMGSSRTTSFIHLFFFVICTSFKEGRKRREISSLFLCAMIPFSYQ